MLMFKDKISLSNPNSIGCGVSEASPKKLLEAHTTQDLLNTTIPQFWTNWKKSTRVMCIWDIVGGASDTPPVPTN